MKHSKTLETILVINMIIMIIFLLIANAVNFNILKRSIKSSLLEKNAAEKMMLINSIDEELLNLSSLGAFGLANQSTLLSYIENNEIQKYSANLSIYQTNKHYFKSLAGVDIVYPKNNIVITDSNYIHYIKKPEDFILYAPWLKLLNENDKAIKILPYGINRYANPSDEVMTIVMKTPISGEAHCIFAIHFNPDKLFTTVDSSFLSIVSNDNLIYISDNSQIDLISQFNKESKTASSYEFKKDSSTYQVNYLKSKDLPLAYEFVTQYKNLYGKNESITIFIISAIFFSIWNILIIAFLSYKNDKIYNSQLASSMTKLGLGHQTKENFDNSIIKLEEHVTRLTSFVELSEPIYIQHSLRMLFSGIDIEDNYKELESRLLFSHFHLLLIYKPGQRIPNNLDEYLKGNAHDSSMISTTINNKLFCVINHSQDYEITNQYRNLPSEYKVLISSIWENNPNNFNKAYHTIEQVREYTFMYPDKRILRFEELNMPSRNAAICFNKLLKKLEVDIKTESSSVFITDLYELRDTLVTSNISIEHCKATLRDLITIMDYQFKEKGLESWAVLGYDIRSHYEKVKDIISCTYWLENCFTLYIDFINQKRNTINSEKLKQSIESYFETTDLKDVSLDSLADSVRLRTDELSRNFKILFGENFSDYLRNLKIQKAKEYLEQDITIKNIAFLLGYSSSQYFIKVFKQTTGMTPNAYKSKIRNFE